MQDARPDDVEWPPLRWPPPPDVVLSGDVIEVTPVDADRDGPELYAALDDDRVWRHLVGRPADAAEFAGQLRAAVLGGRLPWLVRLVRDVAGLAAGTVVGTSSYLDVSVPDARLEVGWTAYAPAVWASAVNPEAKLLLLGYAFDVLGAGRVQLKTDVRNARSQQAIARLGASYEGTLRRYQRRGDGTVRDTVLFSVVAEQWPDVRAALEGRVAAARP